ncbi:MAG: hypothetical protein KatS3mg031_1500 [Chitinophagales bacterium]|nr:MAG: hypothetical protein KatS3mg031_1500 [Chitinophagales bacterium]
MYSITIHNDARLAIEDDAVKTYPDECCGFLFGTEKNGERFIILAKPVNNIHQNNRKRRFEISPLEYMKAEEFADKNGWLLLGVYHSHPEHPAIPSDYDLKRALPFFSYIIVSVIQTRVAEFRSWRLNEAGLFMEEGVHFSDAIKH